MNSHTIFLGSIVTDSLMQATEDGECMSEGLKDSLYTSDIKIDHE